MHFVRLLVEWVPDVRTEHGQQEFASTNCSAWMGLLGHWVEQKVSNVAAWAQIAMAEAYFLLAFSVPVDVGGTTSSSL